MEKIKIAIIDFDGTLYNGESMPYIWKKYSDLGYSRRRQIIAGLKILPDMYFSKKKYFKKITMQSYKDNATNHMLKMFKGFNEEDMLEFFNKVYKLIEVKFNNYVLKRIIELKQQGFKIVLISGSFDDLIKIVADNLNIDYSVGTKLNYLDSGLLDSKTRLNIIKKELKVKELNNIISSDKIDYENSISFSDSISDFDILNVVRNKEIINPDSSLKELALKNNWKITIN